MAAWQAILNHHNTLAVKGQTPVECERPSDTFSSPSWPDDQLPGGTRPVDSSKTTQRPTFRHKPLDGTTQEIRLCQTLPKAVLGFDTDIVNCSITHHVLEAPPDSLFLGLDLEYKALSYCWGDENDLEDILVDGKHLSVRRNLANFLKAIRDTEDDDLTLFWVDQLCIDQANVDERNHQVSLMSTIYSQATAVYAWLGMETDLMAPGFAVLKGFEDNTDFSGPDSKDGNVMRKLFYDFMMTTEPFEISAFLMLLSQEYWRRVWIVQEVFLGKEMIIWCGALNQRISGHNGWPLGLGEGESDANDSNSMSTLLKSKDLRDPRLLERWNIAYDASTLLFNRSLRLDASTNKTLAWMRLDHAVTSASPRHCSDPRDYVLGVQACLDPAHRVVIDYGKTVEETVLELMKGPNLLLHDEFMALALSMDLQIIFREQKTQALLALRQRHAGNAFLEAVRRHGLSLDVDPQYEVSESIEQEHHLHVSSQLGLQGEQESKTADQECRVDVTNISYGALFDGWDPLHVKGFAFYPSNE